MAINIIICGGGVGGLAAAGYLRARHNVTVLERGSLDFANDYGLSVVSNAFNLLQKAGIKSENMNSVVMTHLWVRSWDNKELQTIHFDTRREANSAPSVMTYRARLQKELLRFATSTDFPGRPAVVVPDARVSQVDVDHGKVWTADGRLFEGDLIIGADGINSTVRSAVLGRDSSADVKLHDLMIFISRVPIAAIQADASLGYLANPDSQAGLVTFRSAAGNESKKRLLIYHTSPEEVQILGYSSEKEFADQFDAAGTTIIRHVPTSRVVAEFGSEFSENLVSLFRHNPIDAWRIRDMDTCQVWHRGKAVLIGDAAHAVTPHAGHGCNMAIEDAEALGFLLDDSASAAGMEEILDKFAALRQGRAQLVLRRSREAGDLQSEEEKKLGPIGAQEFSVAMHSYQGAEHALKNSIVA